MITINIKATNMELTEALKDYTEKRLSALQKYIQGDATAMVEIGKTTEHHKHGDYFRAEINMTTTLGKQFRAASEKSDLYEAIDDVRDEMVQMISSAKGKSEALWKRGARRVKNILKGFRS